MTTGLGMISNRLEECAPGKIPLYKFCERKPSYVDIVSDCLAGKVNSDQLFRLIVQPDIFIQSGFYDIQKFVMTHLHDMSRE